MGRGVAQMSCSGCKGGRVVSCQAAEPLAYPERGGRRGGGGGGGASGAPALNAPALIAASTAPTILRGVAPASGGAGGATTVANRASEAKRLFLPAVTVMPDVFARYTEALEVLCVCMMGADRQRMIKAVAGDASQVQAQDAWLTADQMLVMDAGAGADESEELGSAVLAWSASQVVVYCAPVLNPSLLTRIRLIAALAGPYVISPPMLVVLLPHTNNHAWLPFGDPSSSPHAHLASAITAAVGSSARVVQLVADVRSALGVIGSMGGTGVARKAVVLRDWNKALARTAQELRSGATLNECSRLLL